MQLYLVQHGEAVAKDVDPDRPLSERGMADVAHITGFMKNAGVSLEKILHSGKTRAEQTANILAGELLGQGEAAAISGISPNDPVEPFLQEIENWTVETLVVGHLPFMAKLVAHLVVNNEIALTAYQPGSVVCLAKGEDEHWQIQWMLRPELLSQ